jgi:hypothetical protein
MDDGCGGDDDVLLELNPSARRAGWMPSWEADDGGCNCGGSCSNEGKDRGGLVDFPSPPPVQLRNVVIIEDSEGSDGGYPVGDRGRGASRWSGVVEGVAGSTVLDVQWDLYFRARIPCDIRHDNNPPECGNPAGVEACVAPAPSPGYACYDYYDHTAIGDLCRPFDRCEPRIKLGSIVLAEVKPSPCIGLAGPVLNACWPKVSVFEGGFFGQIERSAISVLVANGGTLSSSGVATAAGCGTDAYPGTHRTYTYPGGRADSILCCPCCSGSEFVEASKNCQITFGSIQ